MLATQAALFPHDTRAARAGLPRQAHTVTRSGNLEKLSTSLPQQTDATKVEISERLPEQSEALTTESNKKESDDVRDQERITADAES